MTFKVPAFICSLLETTVSQGTVKWEWTHAPHKGLGGGTQCGLPSATARAVTTQESTEGPVWCHPSQIHWHWESLSSSAVEEKGGMAARNQAYLSDNKGMRSRLSHETPRSPQEQSSSQMQELCCEERNTGYIFQ